jgi:predicted dehydrogenase
MKVFRVGIVVGVGSIGIKHARFLESISEDMILIDNKFNTSGIADLKKEFESAHFLKHINELSERFTDKDIAVIANWGPDHYETLVYLVSKGFRNFVLEKPCVDSLDEVKKLWTLAYDTPLKIAVNQGWFYDKIGLTINSISRDLGLGKAVAIFISGGARCISTAGSHWISLANQLFSSEPQVIFSDARNDLINPRSPSLSFYEGVFSFRYPQKERLAINLTNDSSIEGKIEIYWQNALGLLDSNKLYIYKRNDDSTPNKITRYGKAEQLVYSGPVFDLDNSLANLYKSFHENNQIEFNGDFLKHLKVTSSIIYALISSEINKKIYFEESVDKEFYLKKYKIS